VTNSHLDQILIESVAAGSPNTHFDQALHERITAGSPNGRFDQALLESVSVGSPRSHVCQLIIEYVVSMPENPVIPTIVFPSPAELGGTGWSVHRRPTFSTRVAAADSGREVRSPYYATPLYEFELTFDGVLSGAAMGSIPAQSMQLLQGFFLQMAGQYGSFLFTDPDFNQMTGAVIGTGDGSSAVFALQRNVGNYSEVVQAANTVTAVYLNGAPQTGGTWSVTNGNQITFATAPAKGAVVTADFTYYFVCRFLDDVHDYEEFMSQIHTLQSCKFRTVRTQ
jgi:uncharacterized protein (TIGR02217 family)